MGADTSGGSATSHRRMLFFMICVVYFFVYFHRMSTSVIVPDLLAAFKTNAAALGVMSSMYFYLYALEQPLVGFLTDRLGPLRVIGIWSLVAAVGCVLFGLAPSIGWASLGRGMIGIGVGGVYVPALKAIAQWFEEKQFTGLLGTLMSIGNLGGVVATTPLAWAAVTWGWRPTFFVIGALTLGLAAMALAGHRLTRPEGQAGTKAVPEAVIREKSTSRPGIGNLLTSGHFWAAGLLFFIVYGTLVTFQGLWATPFLMSSLSVDRMVASRLNMLISIGMIVGAPLFGWLTARFGMDKLRLLTVSLILTCLAWAALIFGYRMLGSAGLGAVQFLMGLAVGGFVTLLWGIIRETTPPEVFGLTSGLLNPSPLLGVAAFQVATGAILDKTGKIGLNDSVAGYKRAFLLCLAFNLVCFAFIFYLGRMRRKKRRS